MFLPREHKIHIFEPTCNVLFIIWRLSIEYFRRSFLNPLLGSLRSPRQLLQWKRYFKIELCVVLNVLRSFRAGHVVQNSCRYCSCHENIKFISSSHVVQNSRKIGHVVQNSRSLLSLDRHELFSYKWRERKVYCYRLTLSSKLQIWNFKWPFGRPREKHCSRGRTACGARLLFIMQPITSLICDILVAVSLNVSQTP